MLGNHDKINYAEIYEKKVALGTKCCVFAEYRRLHIGNPPNVLTMDAETLLSSLVTELLLRGVITAEQKKEARDFAAQLSLVRSVVTAPQPAAH